MSNVRSEDDLKALGWGERLGRRFGLVGTENKRQFAINFGRSNLIYLRAMACFGRTRSSSSPRSCQCSTSLLT